MALLPSDTPVGPNSLEGLPLDEQNFLEFTLGRTLVSGIMARTDARCSAPSSTFDFGGPVLINEAASALAVSASNLSIQTAATQTAIDQVANLGPVITDDEVSSAPQATTLGSTPQGTGDGPVSTPLFTPAQIAQATGHPKRWADTVTFKPNQGKTLSRSRVGVLIGGGGEELTAAGMQKKTKNARGLPVSTAGQQRFGGAPWGSIAAAPCGGLSQFPKGKLLLLGGLGLIAVGMLTQGSRRR